MGGNIIKLLLKSFADLSGITKWNDSVKSSIGNMGQMSRAAHMLGATLGVTGGAIGRLVGAIAQGSVWGFAAQGISMLIERFDLFGKKAEEAREKNEELAESVRQRYADINADAATALENINNELQAQKTMADIIDRRYKAELQLRRAEALRSGDLAKAQNIEAAMADADRQSAVDRADAEAAAAEKRVAAAKRALDAMQKKAREADKRESDAEAALAAKSKPITTVMQSSAGAFIATTKRNTDKEKSNLAIARKDAEAAEAAVEKAKAAYDIEVEKWRVAKENAKAVAKEQEAAAEKEFAERIAAEKKRIKDKSEAEEAARKKSQDEWLKEQKKKDAQAAEARWIEQQKEYQKEAAERERIESERLQKDKAANTAKANDLKDKLKKAQEDASNAFNLFRNSDDLDQKAERRAKRQERIDKEKLTDAAIDLQGRRKDWRTATNLSNRDEAARRYLLALENKRKVEGEQKQVIDKLTKIEELLKAATTL